MRALARDLTAALASEEPRNLDGKPMPRTNYHQLKRQKELARKARKLEKQQRRAAKATGNEESAATDTNGLTSERPSAPHSGV